MATYVNNLRLMEIATGAESGTWGTKTNTNLELIADAFGSGTEAITDNANTHTTTIANGEADEGRAIFLKYTGNLDSNCTITLAPNTINKLWFIENATGDSGSSGPYSIIISQGSGANITIGNGKVAAVYTDGAAGSAAVIDAFADLELSSTLTVAGTSTLTGAVTSTAGIQVSGTSEIQFGDAASRIFQSADSVLRIDGEAILDLYGSTSVNVSHDLLLNSDASILGFGVNNDTTLTHVHDTGLLLNSTRQLQFGDSGSYIQQSGDGVLRINGEGTVDIYGSSMVAISNDLRLNTDAAVLSFGVDSEVTLTHVHDTGLLLNDAMALQFNDASQYINAPTATVLDITATDEIELNATAVDLNGTLDVSGTSTLTGAVTASAGITCGDANITNVGDIACDSVSSDGSTATVIYGPLSSGATELADSVTNAGLFIQSKTGSSGGLAIGVRSDSEPYIQGVFSTEDAARQLHINPYGAGISCLSVACSGAMSKGSGSFLIDHPLPSMKDTHNLVHSFVEGPRADLIYRGSVALSSGSASVDLDVEVGMTDGTWELLCRDPQVFLQNESGWSALKGSVSGSTLIITCKDTTSFDTVSWMVVAERQDEHMRDSGTDWTDSDGRVILEPLKRTSNDVEDGS